MVKLGTPYVHRVKITVEWASGLDSGTRELTMDNDSHDHATRMYTLEGVIALLGLANQQQISPAGENADSSASPQSRSGSPE